MTEVWEILSGKIPGETSAFTKILSENSLTDLGIAAGIAAGSFILLFSMKRVVGRFLGRMANRRGTFVPRFFSETFARSGSFFFAVIALDIGSRWLELADRARGVLDRILVVALILQCARWLNHVVKLAVGHYRELHAQDDPNSARVPVRFVGIVVRSLIWIISSSLVLQTIGFDVTSLVAGLGISGIVVALAAQNIVSDLFASLMIVVDKPFVVGDVISLDGMTGRVETVGIKTTRLRSVDGELLLIGNQDLLKSRLRNFMNISERRSVFRIGVEYGTSPELLERIPEMVRTIVESVPGARFDRGHFARFAESALEFEFSVYVEGPDYVDFMNGIQAINLGICRAFAREGIAFAFPTRTIEFGKSARGVWGSTDSQG
ncbi:MAG TPA: mechanosensitive ion channel family protein [Spirochaetota bacterium]|nr:mechanosensitive ion channel family protein [Spirochaetota bacterium]